MAKQSSRENRPQPVRVLYFGDQKPNLPPNAQPSESDAAADAIRKAWTQKSATPKQPPRG